MGKEILEPCWVNKEVFSITTSFRVVVTMTIWAPCKPSSSMHLWTMEVNSWAYHFWNNLCVTCGRPFPFGLFLVPIFHHFGVPLHLCFPESCTYIRLGSMKLMSFLPLHHPGSTFAPLSLSLAFCFLTCSSIRWSICSSSFWLICPFSSAFPVISDDNPVLDPFSFLSDDSLDQSITRCDLILLQAAIDHHKMLSTMIQLCPIRCTFKLTSLFSIVSKTR